MQQSVQRLQKAQQAIQLLSCQPIFGRRTADPHAHAHLAAQHSAGHTRQQVEMTREHASTVTQDNGNASHPLGSQWAPSLAPRAAVSGAVVGGGWMPGPVMVQQMHAETVTQPHATW